MINSTEFEHKVLQQRLEEIEYWKKQVIQQNQNQQHIQDLEMILEAVLVFFVKYFKIDLQKKDHLFQETFESLSSLLLQKVAKSQISSYLKEMRKSISREVSADRFSKGNASELLSNSQIKFPNLDVPQKAL